MGFSAPRGRNAVSGWRLPEKGSDLLTAEDAHSRTAAVRHRLKFHMGILGHAFQPGFADERTYERRIERPVLGIHHTAVQFELETFVGDVADIEDFQILSVLFHIIGLCSR